ncbi:hypothetical protein CXQ82_10735 [Pseudomonas sp. S09G 359]|nr:hypothetical protein CXQ82_10735 [Pseudomonas sp. S09G 359]
MASGLARVGLRSSPSKGTDVFSESTQRLILGPLRSPTRASPLATITPNAEGAFKGKSTSNYVANVLGMGRATVYKHLKELKG